MNPQDPVGSLVTHSAATTFRAGKAWTDKAIVQLDDDQLHVPLDPETNCCAVIMKHVAGNLLSRWTDFLTTDGEKPWRNRDDEFIDTLTDRAELLAYWEKGWQCLFDALEALQPEDLLKTIEVRGEPHTVPLAIHRSLGHCSYHTGQIIMIARILVGENWNVITIPRGGSAEYNKNVWGQQPFKAPTDPQ